MGLMIRNTLKIAEAFENTLVITHPDLLQDFVITGELDWEKKIMKINIPTIMSVIMRCPYYAEEMFVFTMKKGERETSILLKTSLEDTRIEITDADKKLEAVASLKTGKEALFFIAHSIAEDTIRDLTISVVKNEDMLDFDVFVREDLIEIIKALTKTKLDLLMKTYE